MKIKSLLALATTSVLNIAPVFANEILADTGGLGLTATPPSESISENTTPPDKIIDYGEGVYVREYNDYGRPMVEVHPDRGPNYYFSEETLLKPSPEDGVRFRDTPNWMVKEW